MEKIVPIKIGDILNLGITKFGKNGDPLIIYNKFIIFLKNTDKKGFKLNQMIKVKITKVMSNFAFAEQVLN